MTVGGDLDRAEIADERLGVAGGEVGRHANRPLVADEVEQVLGGRAVAIDRVDAGAEHVLVVVEPALAQVGDRQRLEAEDRDVPGRQLCVGLRSQSPGGGHVRPDARPAALAVIVVAQVPDLAPAVPSNLPHAERLGR